MFEQSQKIIEAMIEQKIIPGASYAFIQKGQKEVIVRGNSSLFPIEKELKKDVLYDIASLTKVVGTTSLILKRVDENQLKIDDSIQRYLPEINDNRITLRHLLTHTSGVTGYIKNRNQLSASELKKALLGLSFGRNFNQKMVYSDIGMLYLGWIIERIHSESIQTTIQKEILNPLKMTESTFQPEKERCVPTIRQTNGEILQGRVHDPKAAVLKEHCGSAGLFSTLSDLVRFAEYYLSREDGPILTTTRQNLYHDWSNCGAQRSLGWDLRYKMDAPVLYHTGYTGTFMLLDQVHQEAFIFLSNRIHPLEHNQRFLFARDALVAQFLKEGY